MKKSKTRRRIKWLIIIGVIMAIPISIVWYGWANTFFVIIPPGETKTFPNGAIIWSYYDDRSDRILSVNFIQEVNVKSMAVLTYNYLMSDFQPMIFPYNERIHEIVSKGIGQSIFDVIPNGKQEKKQKSDVEPKLEELDNWQVGESEIC